IGSQMVNVSGNVYRLAAANSISTPVSLGNIHAGDTFGTSALTVTNTAASDAFSEKLDASFSGTTGDATSNGGTISLLVPQRTNSAEPRSRPGHAGYEFRRRP